MDPYSILCLPMTLRICAQSINLVFKFLQHCDIKSIGCNSLQNLSPVPWPHGVLYSGQPANAALSQSRVKKSSDISQTNYFNWIQFKPIDIYMH